MLVLWSDAVAYPLQHNYLQHITATHSHPTQDFSETLRMANMQKALGTHKGSYVEVFVLFIIWRNWPNFDKP